MTSPNTKYMFEELHHFKHLWLKYRKLANDAVALLCQADCRDIEDGHKKLFKLEEDAYDLQQLDKDDFEYMGGYID